MKFVNSLVECKYYKQYADNKGLCTYVSSPEHQYDCFFYTDGMVELMCKRKEGHIQ